MRIETLYCVKPVHAPGRGPTRTTDTHFTAKAGFAIELNEQNGWVRVERHGEVRLVPPNNVSCLIPLTEREEKPGPKPKGPFQPKAKPFAES